MHPVPALCGGLSPEGPEVLDRPHRATSTPSAGPKNAVARLTSSGARRVPFGATTHTSPPASRTRAKKKPAEAAHVSPAADKPQTGAVC